MKQLFLLLAFMISFSSIAQLSPAEKEQAVIPLITNDISLPKMLKDFYDSARYYRVDYKDQLINLKEVRYIKSDLNFLGSVSEDGSIIYLNVELLNYEYLSRIILYRQFGKLYGLEDDLKKSHAIMGTHWELNLQHELYASHLAERPWHKANFFEALAKKHPIEKRL